MRLKRYLLYFDRIVIAPGYQPYLGINLVSEHVQTLLGQGIISSFPSRVMTVPKYDFDFIDQDVLKVFQDINATEGLPRVSGAWAMSEVADASFANSVTLTIADLLPAPPEQTQLSDIINFRSEHVAELERLAQGIKKLLATFLQVNAFDIGRLEIALQEIRDVAGALEKYGERNGLFLGRIKLDVSNFVNSGVIPWVAELMAHQLHAPPFVGIGLGTVLQLQLRKSRFKDMPNSFPRCYEYIMTAFDSGLMHSCSSQNNDYIDLYLNDSNNTLSFAMPPLGTPIMLPIHNKASISNNIWI